MIIWNGLGFLVAVIAFGCLLAAEILTEAAFADDQYYQSHGWPKLVAFLVAAMMVWPLGRYLNSKRAKRLIDPETNEEVILHNRHAFFFIRMEYWGPILIALGVLFLFVTE